MFKELSRSFLPHTLLTPPPDIALDSNQWHREMTCSVGAVPLQFMGWYVIHSHTINMGLVA